MKNDITATIRELLFSHDCVIIPGFGGFILNYVPAAIDKSDSLFYPPARRVSFNRNLNHNDGLLIGAVSRSHDISYSEAMDITGKFATDLKKRISRGEQVVFEHIGTFQANREGNIQFEPDRNANYNLGSYGLEPVKYEPMAGYDVRKRIMKPGTKPLSTGMPWRKMLVRAAVAVPVLIALVAVPLRTDLFRSQMDKASLNPLASTELEQNRRAIDEMPVVSVTGDDPAGTVVEIPAVVEIPEVTSAIPVDEEVVLYHLIAGSFRSVENARAMAGKLRSMGYQPELMDAPDGYTRVSASGFPDLGSANAAKARLSETVEGLWVLKSR